MYKLNASDEHQLNGGNNLQFQLIFITHVVQLFSPTLLRLLMVVPVHLHNPLGRRTDQLTQLYRSSIADSLVISYILSWARVSDECAIVSSLVTQSRFPIDNCWFINNDLLTDVVKGLQHDHREGDDDEGVSCIVSYWVSEWQASVSQWARLVTIDQLTGNGEC